MEKKTHDTFRRVIGALCIAIVFLSIAIAVMGQYVVEAQTRPPEVIIEYAEVPVEGVMPFYNSIGMNYEERDMLAKIVYLEAGNQSMTGQRCVVEVVFNRMMHPAFPDTVSGVLSQPGQFSTYKNLDLAKPSPEQYEAIDIVLASSEPILPVDTIFFATSVANGKMYEKIGGHYFCR